MAPMTESPCPLRLPAVFLRYWSDPRAESYAESVVAPFCDLPGVRRVGARFLAPLPPAGEPGGGAAAGGGAPGGGGPGGGAPASGGHLRARGREDGGRGWGVLVVPGWARVAGRGVSREPEPLLDELELRPPRLPRDRVYLTGY